MDYVFQKHPKLPAQQEPQEAEQGSDSKLLNTKPAFFSGLVRKNLSRRAAIVHMPRATLYRKEKGWVFLGRGWKKKKEHKPCAGKATPMSLLAFEETAWRDSLQRFLPRICKRKVYLAIQGMPKPCQEKKPL